MLVRRSRERLEWNRAFVVAEPTARSSVRSAYHFRERAGELAALACILISAQGYASPPAQIEQRQRSQTRPIVVLTTSTSEVLERGFAKATDPASSRSPRPYNWQSRSLGYEKKLV